MDISEGVMCSHCNTRVYKQLLVDHVQQELLSETTCRPCSDLVQTLTDLLCALHLYGHLKPPVINITCSRCSFQARSVEKFVEHLQVSCENVAPAQDTAVSDASAEQGSFKDSCQTYNAENEDEPVGTSSQGQDMGDWDGQQFQQMMSTLLTDTSGKGRQKTSSEHNTGGNCIATIDISSVFEDQDNETSIGLIMECERVKEPNPSQNVAEKNTANQENLKDFSHVQKVKCQKTKGLDGKDKDEDLETCGMKNNNKTVKMSTEKNQQLEVFLKCHICGYSDQKKEDLESHMLESHGKVEYKCDNCNFVATTVGKVLQHQLGHRKTHKCNETHHKSPSMLSCEIFGKEVPNKRHCQRHRGNFTCPACSKSFQSKVALKIHSDVIHENKVLKCSHCEKTFKSYGGYMVHRHVHISKEHTCKDCNMKFRSKTQLYNHRSRAHLSLKECEVCGKLFDLSRLDDHMKTHMGEEAKVYKCTLCPASFKWSQTLRRHQSTHEGLQKCSVCKKDYRGSRQLKRHMATAHKEQT